MTLTFGIATRAGLGTVARRPTGAIGATQETSTTTWGTTPRAGTPRDSAARKRASVTAPKPTAPARPGAEESPPQGAPIPAARRGAIVTAATPASRTQRNPRS